MGEGRVKQRQAQWPAASEPPLLCFNPNFHSNDADFNPNAALRRRATNNFILMGDQMQLGQPVQGTHPGESGLFTLDYLLHDRPTISEDRGIFLKTIYRTHSAINQFISEAIYDGKLHAHPDNDQQVVEAPEDYVGPLNREAGIIFIPVEHEGNTQASDDEEVEAIQQAVRDLLGRQFTGKDGTRRPIVYYGRRCDRAG